MECFKLFKKNWINFRNKPPHSKWFKFRVFNHFTTISRNCRKKLLILKNFLSYLRNKITWVMYFLGIRNVEARECSKLEPLILMHFLQMKKMNVSYVFFISYLYLYQAAACLAKWTLSDRLKAAWNLIENKIDCPISCHLLNGLLQTIRLQDSIRMSASASKFRNLKYYLWNMRYHPKTAPQNVYVL